MQPENQYLINKIRAARSAQIKPTSMILRTQPTEPWKPIDFSLLEALQTIEQETCPQCGNFIWLCDWQDRDVHMKANIRVCNGTIATRQRQNKNIKDKEQRDNDAKSSGEWGVSYYATAELDPQSERTALPTRREYYEQKKSLNV